MTTWSRRGVLLGSGAVGTGAALAGAAEVADAATPAVTFVSMPDFFNGDVADLSVLPTWDGGLNSVNASWETAIDTCLGAVASHRPDAVLLAGDLVEGRWNVDSDNRQLFGPVSPGTDPVSLALCRSAIRRAGDVYYGYHRELFASRDLTVYPAVGDHEILDDRSGPLDDRWSPSGRHRGEPDNRYHLVDTSKQVWSDHFTRTPGGRPRFAHRPEGAPEEFTAYRVSFADALTLITVDMFHLTDSGVRLGVFGRQLGWLRREIRLAKRRGHVVAVQGHVPTMVPYRVLASGNLHLPQGRRSQFYRALDECGADFFLTGEVHDTTVIQRRPGAPVQISHGCIFRYGFNYLVGRVGPRGTVLLDYYEVPLERASADSLIWSSDIKKRQRTTIEYGAPVHRGRIVYRDGRLVRRTKKLAVYDPGNDPWDYATHLDTEIVGPG